MILNTVSLTAILLTLPGAALEQCGNESFLFVSTVNPSPPSLVLLASPQSLSPGDEVRVVCLAEGFRPDSATLSWSDNGNAVAGAEVQTSSSQRQSDGTFIRSSTLKLSPEHWSSGRTYTCHVNHPALSAPLSQSTSAEKCS
ncbi:hypothetical protein QTP86_014845 [Hemibagrus guttatus]|nr:hypothetical protein QTP86_014845 [Hemibagrus guttatus]